MPISFNGTTGAVTGIVSASSSDLSTSLTAKVSTTGQTGTVNLSTATLTGAGLDLIASQSFSAVSSVSINNCFTSTYENYRIIMRTVLTSSAGLMNARLRSSGTDNSTSNYDTTTFYSAGNNTYGNQNCDNNISTWYAGNIDVYPAYYVYEVSNPQKSEVTLMTSHAAGARSGASLNAMYSGAFRFNQTTSFDGITFYPATSTMTGNIRVYGYRNS
jgi:hypothetical protein